jgi:hypothetical protein
LLVFLQIISNTGVSVLLPCLTSAIMYWVISCVSVKRLIYVFMFCNIGYCLLFANKIGCFFDRFVLSVVLIDLFGFISNRLAWCWIYWLYCGFSGNRFKCALRLASDLLLHCLVILTHSLTNKIILIWRSIWVVIGARNLFWHLGPSWLSYWFRPFPMRLEIELRCILFHWSSLRCFSNFIGVHLW